LAIVVAIIAFVVLLHGHRVSGGELGRFFTVVTTIALLSPYCLTAIVVKRLHDLDRSGWHALVLFAALFFAGLAVMTYGGLQQSNITVPEWREFWTTAFYVFTVLSAALLAYLIVKLGFRRGTLGPNRFGPDPAAPVGRTTGAENA
jgi:uncharacterized membrane protein YhaH (DUF805 family)